MYKFFTVMQIPRVKKRSKECWDNEYSEAFTEKLFQVLSTCVIHLKEEMIEFPMLSDKFSFSLVNRCCDLLSNEVHYQLFLLEMMGRGAFPTEDELSLQRLGLTVLKLERFIYSLGLQAYSKSNIHSEIAFANINRKGGNGGHFKSTFHEPESYLITWGITASSAYGTLRICKLIYESMRNKFEIEHQSFFQHEPKDTRDHVLLSSMFAVGIATAWSLDSNVISRVQVGLIGDKFIMKPILQEMENSQLDLLLTGTKSGISLIERYCDFLPEDRLLEIVEAGQNVVRRYISRSGVFESNKMMSELLEKDIGIKKGARFIWKMLVYCRPD